MCVCVCVCVCVCACACMCVRAHSVSTGSATAVCGSTHTINLAVVSRQVSDNVRASSTAPLTQEEIQAVDDVVRDDTS